MPNANDTIQSTIGAFTKRAKSEKVEKQSPGLTPGVFNSLNMENRKKNPMQKGVRKENAGFTACLRHGKKTVHLGTFDTYDMAVAAQKEYREANGLPEKLAKGRPRMPVPGMTTLPGSR